MDEEPLMRIGEIAAFFNVSVKAIRLYEKMGLVIPAKVDSVTGYRYYSADQVQTLDALLELKTLGFSLAEIKKILQGGATNGEFIGALTRKQRAWQDVVSSAEYKLDAIASIINRLSQSQDAAKLQDMTDEQRAWLLVKMVCVEDLRMQNLLSQAIWL